MWSRKFLKTRAKEVLRVSYWKAFLVSLIIAFVGGNGSSFNYSWHSGNGQSQNFSGSNLVQYIPLVILGGLVVGLIALGFRILLGYPLEVGGRRYFAQAAQDNVDLNSLGFAFEKPRYINILKSMLWRGFLNFLWFLLLIIPGIVKAYAYSMIPYILADNPNIGYKRALDISVKMTAGEKFDMWILDLSFIGWYILGTLAFLIGILFVLPYVNATKAELYLVLRQKALDKGICSKEELLLLN